MHSVADDICDKSIIDKYYFHLFIYSQKRLNTTKKKNMLRVHNNYKQVTNGIPVLKRDN